MFVYVLIFTFAISIAIVKGKSNEDEIKLTKEKIGYIDDEINYISAELLTDIYEHRRLSDNNRRLKVVTCGSIAEPAQDTDCFCGLRGCDCLCIFCGCQSRNDCCSGHAECCNDINMEPSVANYTKDTILKAYAKKAKARGG